MNLPVGAEGCLAVSALLWQAPADTLVQLCSHLLQCPVAVLPVSTELLPTALLPLLYLPLPRSHRFESTNKEQQTRQLVLVMHGNQHMVLNACLT